MTATPITYTAALELLDHAEELSTAATIAADLGDELAAARLRGGADRAISQARAIHALLEVPPPGAAAVAYVEPITTRSARWSNQ